MYSSSGMWRAYRSVRKRCASTLSISSRLGTRRSSKKSFSFRSYKVLACLQPCCHPAKPSVPAECLFTQRSRRGLLRRSYPASCILDGLAGLWSESDALSSDALWPGRLGLEAFCAVVVGSALSSLARLFSWLLAFTALRVGIGAQPQRNVGGLHRLPHHTH